MAKAGEKTTAWLPAPDDRRIAEEIKRRREKKKLSQAQLGKAIGSSALTIWRYENLERPVNPRFLRRIEEALGPLWRPKNGEEPGTAGREHVADELPDGVTTRGLTAFLSRNQRRLTPEELEELHNGDDHFWWRVVRLLRESIYEAPARENPGVRGQTRAREGPAQQRSPARR